MILYTEISNFTQYGFYSFVVMVKTPNRGMYVGDVMQLVEAPIDALIINLRQYIKEELTKYYKGVYHTV
jgi:hypothetical protein